MARDNFQPCIDVVLVYEGGKSLIRSDPGNWTGNRVGVGHLKGTNFGIAAGSHPNLDVMNLTRDQACQIYRAEYWNKIGGDSLPAGVDLAVLDPAVNSGPGKAKVWYAQARATAKTDTAVIHAICAERLSFLHALGNWKRFGGGWGRRVASVEAKATRMALGRTPQATTQIHAKANEQAKAAVKAKGQANAVGLTSAVGTTATASAGGHWGWAIAIVVLGAVAAGVSAFVAWRLSQRAHALTLEAKAV